MGKNSFNTFGLDHNVVKAKPKAPDTVKWDDLKKELEKINKENQEILQKAKEKKAKKPRRRRDDDDDDDDDDPPPRPRKNPPPEREPAREDPRPPKPAPAPDNNPQKPMPSQPPPPPPPPQQQQQPPPPPLPKNSNFQVVSEKEFQGLTKWPPSRPPSAYNLVRTKSADNIYTRNPGGYQPSRPSQPAADQYQPLSTGPVDYGVDPLVAWILNGRNEDVGQSESHVILPDQLGRFARNGGPLPPAPNSYGARLLANRPRDAQWNSMWLSQNPEGRRDEDEQWRKWLFNGQDDSHKLSKVLKFPPINGRST